MCNKKQYIICIITFIALSVNVTVYHDTDCRSYRPALLIKTHLCAGTTQP